MQFISSSKLLEDWNSILESALLHEKKSICLHILPAELAAGLHGGSHYKILFLQFGQFLTA